MKRFNITVNGKAYDVVVDEVAAGSAPAPVAAPAPMAAPAPAPAAAPAAPAPAAPTGGTKINSPMPGNILDVKVKEGESVASGQVLVVLEAMKMENDIMAAAAGTVTGVHVKKGDTVDTGTLLITIA